MKSKLQGFFLGIILTSILFVLSSTALADSNSNFLINKVNVVVDGTQVAKQGNSYTLPDGTSVPFSILHNGTTYLPIRKISEIIGKEINWDSDTNTVIIGADTTSSQMPSAAINATDYYPGTSYFTFTKVTGVPLKETYSDTSLPVNIYTYKVADSDVMMEYIYYLVDEGFSILDDDRSGTLLTVGLVKDTMLCLVAMDFSSNIVMVTPPYG